MKKLKTIVLILLSILGTVMSAGFDAFEVEDDGVDQNDLLSIGKEDQGESGVFHSLLRGNDEKGFDGESQDPLHPDNDDEEKLIAPLSRGRQLRRNRNKRPRKKKFRRTRKGKNKPTKSRRFSKSPKSSKENVGCPTTGSGSKRAKATICHFVEATSEYETKRLNSNRADKYVARYEKDYCGECIGENFAKVSVLRNLPPVEGIEEVGGYQAVFNATYLEAGIVALAPSRDSIESVCCGPGYVEIVFVNPLSSQQLPEMFPEFTLLAVDGITFGIDCNVYETDTGMGGPRMNSGFLIIRSAALSGDSSVRVDGIPASFDYLFQEEYLWYNSTNTIDNRRLARGDVTYKKEFPEDGIAQAEITLTLTVDANIAWVKKDWRIKGERWWELDPYIDLATQFSHEVNLTLGTKLSVKSSISVEVYNKEFPWKHMVIPNAGIQLPGLLIKGLKKILPDESKLREAFGLLIDIPAAIKFEAKLDTGIEIPVELGTITSGRKTYQFSLKGALPLPLPDFDVVEDKPFNVFGPSLENVPAFSDLSTNDLKLELFAGLVPQIKFDAIGLVEASIGFYAGADVNLKAALTTMLPPVEAEPGFPMEVFCEDCHDVEIDIDIVAKEPFARAKALSFLSKGPEAIVIDVPDLSMKIPLAKICAVDHPEATPCEKTCCMPGTTCIVDSFGRGSCSDAAPKCSTSLYPGLEGECRALSSLGSCPYHLDIGDCESTMGSGAECCFDEFPCSGYAGGNWLEGFCFDASQGSTCEVPIPGAVDCVQFGVSMECCPSNFDPSPCSYGAFSGDCIHKDVCRARGGLALSGHCPAYGNDILCCFNNLDNDSCVASSKYPGQCASGGTCGSPSDVLVDTMYTPGYVCSSGELCCVECNIELSSDIECCSNADCTNPADVCYGNQCECEINYANGIMCCKNEDCGYEFEICTVDNKCQCEVGRAGAECCANSDCPSEYDTCRYERCTCEVDWNRDIQCCSDNDCGYAFEVCTDDKQCECKKGRGGAECCINEDCPSPYDTCRWERCVCEVDWSRGIECCSNDDCEGCTDEKKCECEVGKDGALCCEDDDCQPTETCTNNQCSCRVDYGAGIECCTDSDCGSSYECSNSNQCECIADSAVCCVDSDCPSGDICLLNECSAECEVGGRIVCCKDEDCSGGAGSCQSNRCICKPNPDFGICCSNEECAEGFLCFGNTCQECGVSPGVECCSDSDCGDTNSFRCENYKCFEKECNPSLVECCQNSDCPNSYQICKSTRCILRGNPRFTLQWRGDDDLDLHVTTPLGGHIWYDDKVDGATLGALDKDEIPGVKGRYVENIRFPLGGSAPLGIYEYWVDLFGRIGEEDAWSVSVHVDNLFIRRDTGFGSSQKYIFDLGGAAI